MIEEGHPGLDGIYFTGSTATGRRIMENSAGNPVRTVMELGGKSPNIVFADADMDEALAGAIFAIFANSGQICVAGSRLLVEESIPLTSTGKIDKKRIRADLSERGYVLPDLRE